jgi:hypothetical protein
VQRRGPEQPSKVAPTRRTRSSPRIRTTNPRGSTGPAEREVRFLLKC